MDKNKVNRGDKKASNMALTGIMMALSLVLLYIGSLLPAIESTFYIFGGVTIGIVITEAGLKNGILLYLGTLILGFFIVPDKSSIILYGFLFGIYSIVKYYIEKLHGKWTQICMKFLFIMMDCLIMWICFRKILLGNVTMNISTMLIGLLIVVIAFFIYDYIFTLCIYIYRKKFKREPIDINLSEINEPVDVDNSIKK